MKIFMKVIIIICAIISACAFISFVRIEFAAPELIRMAGVFFTFFIVSSSIIFYAKKKFLHLSFYPDVGIGFIIGVVLEIVLSITISRVGQIVTVASEFSMAKLRCSESIELCQYSIRDNARPFFSSDKIISFKNDNSDSCEITSIALSKDPLFNVIPFVDFEQYFRVVLISQEHGVAWLFHQLYPSVNLVSRAPVSCI